MQLSYLRFLLFCALKLQAQVLYVFSQETCSEIGAVRLVGGANVTEGRLEICVKGHWGTVCNDGFDANAAAIVCRQLGVQESALATVQPIVFFGGGASFQQIHLDELHCSGAEATLLNCTHSGVGVHDCKHYEDVGIICKRSQDCTDGDVRLVDGDNYNATAGRVEYCIAGLWGTVCDYGWENVDAEVVCRQLGLNTFEPKILSKTAVPRVRNPQVPIVLDGLNCQGSEAKLADCNRRHQIEDCSHSSNSDYSDAGAFCTNVKECNDSDVRLFHFTEDNENEGRVEFCSSGRWILVCNDFWDNDDATVLCRQLGYNVNDGDAVAKTASIRGYDKTNAFRGPVDCIGTEENISQCPHRDNSICIKLGAGVICPLQQNVSECTDRDVRLQGGELSNEIGRVEVCMSGQWGLVCDDHWDDIDASVVCKQLGYTGGVATRMSTFGIGIGTYILDDVNCTGIESNIFDCQYPKSTHCDVGREEAGVLCGVTTGSSKRCIGQHTNKTVSLVGTNATNATAGSIGTCQRYLSLSNLCSTFYVSSDYIFTAMNQSFLSNELDGRIHPILNGECGDLISKVLCHYFFAPCGANGLLHLPLSICPEECNYVQTACENEWTIVNNLLNNAGITMISCKATSTLLKGLTPCCIDAGIEIARETTPTEGYEDSATTEINNTTSTKLTNNMTSVEESLVTDNNMVGTLSGILVAASVVLLGLIAVAVCLAIVVVKKRKTTIRMLTTQTTPSNVPLTASFMQNFDDVEFGADIKLRNRPQHLPQAIPNPYSTKQELSLSSPLLSPTENKMMNRISSSIIRELSSNMLIPYTRLKLMECVGQGEFGVVYKAQYTEPEGDIGYKTSTVAVKTLKGFFDNSQVNKIMEESIKMKHFDHPNVLHLIGVCLDAGPAPYVVMPYMANGSLLHYLKKERNNLVLPDGVDDDVKIDVRKRLTVMCLQIASGMDYLAGEKFVHRDLAARNCMIDVHFVIKIADFGLSEDIYAKNYFRQSGSDKSVKLPVKWMAPESLSDGVFSEKTDVWSFGVTCWEIFSGGKTPYPGVDPLLLSQMLETEQRLNKPLNAACPDEMYSLMMNCWTKHPNDRLNFNIIVTKISNYTEAIAGYLDISCFNPFKSTHSLYDNEGAAAITTIPSSPCYEKAVLDSTELLEQQSPSNKIKSKDDSSKGKSPKGSPKVTPKVTPKSSPKSSPKPSPRASPRMSPRASPLLKLKKVKDEQQSTTFSTGIEIHIQSPSPDDDSVTSGLLSVK